MPQWFSVQQRSLACGTAQPCFGAGLFFGLFLFLKPFLFFSFRRPHLHKGTRRLQSQHLPATRFPRPGESATRSRALMRRAWPGCRCIIRRNAAGTMAAHVPDRAVGSGSQLRGQIISGLLVICCWPDDICFGLYVYFCRSGELHTCFFFSTSWCKYQRDWGNVPSMDWYLIVGIVLQGFGIQSHVTLELGLKLTRLLLDVVTALADVQGYKRKNTLLHLMTDIWFRLFSTFRSRIKFVQHCIPTGLQCCSVH